MSLRDQRLSEACVSAGLARRAALLPLHSAWASDRQTGSAKGWQRQKVRPWEGSADPVVA
jgi:hypothetical protein